MLAQSLIYLSGILTIVFTIRALHIARLEYILLVIVPITWLIRVSCGKKPTLVDLSKSVFFIWIIFLIFRSVGVLLGGIGIAVLMFVMLFFMVARALTSTHYKESMRSLQPDFNKATGINKWFRKGKKKKQQGK